VATPYRELDLSARELETPYRELDLPARELETPFRELDLPARELETPYRELDLSARELEMPFRELAASFLALAKSCPKLVASYRELEMAYRELAKSVTAMDNEPKRPLRELFEEHSGLALSALYLLLIAIGMMYEWWLFFRFNVNVLYYAEAADFLLVPFREPLVVLVCIGPVPLYMLYIRGARWLGRKLKSPAKPINPDLRTAMNILAAALWSLAFAAHYAGWVSDRIRAGERQSISIRTTTEKTIAGPLIGTTGKFIFVYDTATKQTRIVGVDNVEQIVVEPRKRQ
jgi:hypothetical protein